MVNKHFTGEMKMRLHSFPNNPGFRVTILAIGNAIGSVSAPTCWSNSSGSGPMSLKEKELSCAKATGLMTPCSSGEARAREKFPGMTSDTSNPPNFNKSTFTISKPLAGELVRSAFTSRIGNAKVTSVIDNVIFDAMQTK